MNKLHKHIERRITLGVITSDDFLRKLTDGYTPEYIRAPQARILISWCTEYFEKHSKAPNKDIQEIFIAREQELPEDQAELIGDVLDQMSNEYDPENFNHEYLWEQTKEYFTERHLKLFTERISGSIENGDIDNAKMIAESYSPAKAIQTDGIYPFEDSKAIKEAFTAQIEPLIKLPGAVGDLMNSELVREGFVTFLGREKIGKSFILMDLGFRGVLSGVDTAMFQAGDMSQSQQLRRMGMWVNQKSYKEKYCREMFLPVLDCIHNQLDNCDKTKRVCDEGCFSRSNEKAIDTFKREQYETAFNENPDYKPCIRCRGTFQFKGALWYKKRKAVTPLTYREAKSGMKAYGTKFKARFKLATYANETLDTKTIENQLWLWETRDGFVPSLIIIDYADIMTPDQDCKSLPFREQENKKWQRLRRISQTRKCLLVTATQADANSYDQNTLSASNFSETKTKHAHITAEYGLNQTAVEKEKGIIRINPIMVRDDDFNVTRSVKVLQGLQIGKPILGSYF